MKGEIIELFCFPLIVLGLLFCNQGSSYAQSVGSVSDVVENIGDSGKVDWTNGVATVVAIGAPPVNAVNAAQARAMAKRAALVVAERNLLETLKGTRVDSETLVENFIIASDRIRTAVQGIIRGASEMKTHYMSDGSVEVTIGVKLAGPLSEELLPKPAGPPQPVVPPAPPVAPSPSTAPTTPSVAAAPSGPSGPILTGLVVDARGLRVRPAMVPKILNEDGKEIYGSAFVKREYAIQQGMAGYSKDLAAAQINPRVTNNPLTVKGLRASGSGKTDVVISNADAATIHAAASNLSFLSDCRVMIVVD
jgi:hypothetical protein